MNEKNTSAKSEGKFEELGGTIKKTVGRILGDDAMEAEGKAKELVGKANQESAKADERARGAVEELAGAVKNRVGHLIDDTKMQAEGKVAERKGRARQKSNR